MKKVDLNKELKPFYNAGVKDIVQVDVPASSFKGYAEAIEALFAVSYTIKFMVKNDPQALDYAVMPLEGLWWADDMAAFNVNDRANWKWTAMIMQPDFVAYEVIEKAMTEVRRKKKLLGIDKLRVEEFREGRCAQVHRRAIRPNRQAPRDLLERYPSRRSKPVEDHHSAAYAMMASRCMHVIGRTNA